MQLCRMRENMPPHAAEIAFRASAHTCAGNADCVEHIDLVARIAADRIQAHPGNEADGRSTAEFAAAVRQFDPVMTVRAGMTWRHFHRQALSVFGPGAQHAGVDAVAGGAGEIAATRLAHADAVQRRHAVVVALTRKAGVVACIECGHLIDRATLLTGADRRLCAIADPAVCSHQAGIRLRCQVRAVLRQLQAK
ncbi:hypothetical protein ADT25_02210 [Xanthomonas oryzae]|uniref:Uncharacterized protein n=1 Tax=Xanthomonas oryzae TaxID=347 RepID=A0AAP0ZPQ4_9XANT|nr:hypothetical protein ADT25_02210 [Xanthomonas oryzae]